MLLSDTVSLVIFKDLVFCPMEYVSKKNFADGKITVKFTKFALFIKYHVYTHVYNNYIHVC